MSFIFLFFFILFLIVAIVLSIGASFLRMLFGRPKSNRRKTSGHSGRNDGSNSSGSHKKVFKKDEGEYVDYEEIE